MQTSNFYTLGACKLLGMVRASWVAIEVGAAVICVLREKNPELGDGSARMCKVQTETGMDRETWRHRHIR